jgi:hypothetical protein
VIYKEKERVGTEVQNGARCDGLELFSRWSSQNLGEIVLPAINKEVRRSWMIASTLAKTHDTLNETYNGERQDDRDGTRTIGRRC